MWVPVNLAALAFLPKKGERSYSPVEALFSLQADFWQRRSASIKGYATQWGWHRRKVREFLAQVGAEIIGQVGRRAGQIRPTYGPSTGPSNGSVGTRKIFNDFGQIGSAKIEIGPGAGPSNLPETYHTYLKDLIKSKKAPSAPPFCLEEGQVNSTASEEVGKGEVQKYIRWALAQPGVCDPKALKISIRNRIAAQGGLSDRDRRQMQEDLSKSDDGLPPQTKERVVAYRAILAGRDDGRMAGQYAYPGEDWPQFRVRISRELDQLHRAAQ